MTVDEYFKANKEMWDAYVDIHETSEFYDLKGFLEGKQTLNPIEIEEIGDVRGKSLFHLQCHFGLDTLSWARLGADVTGVDFSEKAITLAKRISKDTEIGARFIQANIYDIPKILSESDQFDIIFTSGGAIVWLPDLIEWAKIIARHLKPGGFFYIREGHPFAYVFDDETDEPILQVRYPYFQGKEPLRFQTDSSYASAEGKKMEEKTAFEWNHSISKIINALIGAGLRIEFFHEFPYAAWKALPYMIEEEHEKWVLPELKDSIPLSFSIKASKEKS
ncbi:MAG: class I SAM-dependent methyltransferase [Candidatus Thorarchaeota archaeon]